MNSIQVYIPAYIQAEAKYVFSVYLIDVLGLDVEWQTSKTNDYKLKIGEHELLIKNAFFHIDFHFEEYYQTSKLPKQLHHLEYILGEENLEFYSYYGQNSMEVSANRITLHSDIISTGFFALSRWEETISTFKDKHNRFRGIDSIAYKFDVIDKPIIEYNINSLWKIIHNFNPKLVKKPQEFTILPTHDIDRYYFIESSLDTLKKQVKNVLSSTQVPLDFKEDPYDKYDFFIKKAEQIQTKAYFFFLVSSKHCLDLKTYRENRLIQALESLNSDKTEIGLHPSYTSLECNANRLLEEKKILENVLNHVVTLSRQHYLKVDYPQTWRQLEEGGIEVDFSVGYADLPGFRTGMARRHRLFDFKNRKEFKILAQPLHIMDTTLKDYMKLSLPESLEIIHTIKAEVSTFGGEFCFLWHNSSFELDGWKEYEPLLDELYKN